MITTPYDQDFYQWTQKMAVALRAGKWHELDINNIAEEIESLGRSEKRALKSRLEILLMHLLKWQYQPKQRSNSWRATVREQRLRIQDLLVESPSLKPYFEAVMPQCYVAARNLAADETGLHLDTFPSVCPYSLNNSLNQDYFPDEHC
ncbi:DUF29 family protein [Synechococcales cyanobacterium C]|uniref:DUF29 family protein n=1 Tax=Petrachloros mirabilis ULC683 TaxID=2781853 RepID=A0A8K2A7G3_9CYAN|nr:DUF29 domain-containing protein [Petrachloros mirabilis]NCJ06055.1 DUF29 family protein [Petrachloros mirabilis ULC683]